jgi:hypothetical protein
VAPHLRALNKKTSSISSPPMPGMRAPSFNASRGCRTGQDRRSSAGLHDLQCGGGGLRETGVLIRLRHLLWCHSTCGCRFGHFLMALNGRRKQGYTQCANSVWQVPIDPKRGRGRPPGSFSGRYHWVVDSGRCQQGDMDPQTPGTSGGGLSPPRRILVRVRHRR